MPVVPVCIKVLALTNGSHLPRRASGDIVLSFVNSSCRRICQISILGRTRYALADGFGADSNLVGQGTLDALPKGRTIPHRHKIEVKFAAPLAIKTYAAQEGLREEHLSTPDAVDGGNAAASQQGLMAWKEGLPVAGDANAPLLPATAPHGQVLPLVAASRQALAAASQPELAAQPTPVLDDSDKSARKAARTKFTEDLRATISVMLGKYGTGKGPKKPEPSLTIAQRLGGRKWRLVGWFGYWLPMALVIITAVALAGLQSWQAGAGFPLRAYATAAGVFTGLTGATGVPILLGIILGVEALRALIQWAWPIFVMAPSDDR